MQKHCQSRHYEHRRGPGRPTKVDALIAPDWKKVSCQRLFVQGWKSQYFAVVSPAEVEEEEETLRRQETAAKLPEAEYIRAQIDEVSPWLEMTRWPKYLHGHSFIEVVRLASPASTASDPLLVEFSDSLDRVVEQAHTSIRDDKVNVFDQARINSFIQRRRAFDRPLMIKLRDSTYRSYKQVFKRLICFAYRTIQPENRIELAYRLTARQLGHLDEMIAIGQELIGLKQSQQTRDDVKKGTNIVQKSLEDRLDRDCLHFCISILDHTLKGDLFESTAIGVLAALGVDPEKNILRDVSSFTSYLSAFVKISQMLVIQMSVMMAEEGQIEHPSDVLDEMRERFMIRGIAMAQSELEQLFLIHGDEKREDVIPTFELRDLKDDPTKNAKGWNFCKDPRNDDVLPKEKRWMLHRILQADALRAEFIVLRKKDSKVFWKAGAAKKYISKIDSFLERLLLLIHITAGQPARGTEILRLRHCNTVNGHHRSIFIEDGLVSTVTAYHKGYNIGGSTKIIHRYLPREVGELVVYYLWFILPFWRSLDLLREQYTHAALKRHQEP
ncbi:DNA helicase [Paraphaeosphaeria minitans]|uniref:DNA helicase n=1 Tax=Paraphaeosphaeria minitans TaxID=565426 RepID=A0A9P6G928_9PLEO|nr:DNA helicase [Paraphaeosphaeria minitans]